MFHRRLMLAAACLFTTGALAQTSPIVSEDTYGELPEEVAPYAPPELPQESVPPAPYPGAVWTSGHWVWDNGQWRFNPGAWIAPLAGYQFVNGYWRPEGGLWRWTSGGWARPGSTYVEIPLVATGQELTVAQSPPPARTEFQPPPPSLNVIWAPGYWYWAGASWTWIGGNWVTPPRPGVAFIAPRWVRRGPRWVFHNGGWGRPGSVHVSVPVYRHARVAVRFGHPHYFVHSGWQHHRHQPAPYYRRGPGHYRPGAPTPPPGRYHKARPPNPGPKQRGPAHRGPQPRGPHHRR